MRMTMLRLKMSVFTSGKSVKVKMHGALHRPLLTHHK